MVLFTDKKNPEVEATLKNTNCSTREPILSFIRDQPYGMGKNLSWNM